MIAEKLWSHGVVGALTTLVALTVRTQLILTSLIIVNCQTICLRAAAGNSLLWASLHLGFSCTANFPSLVIRILQRNGVDVWVEALLLVVDFAVVGEPVEAVDAVVAVVAHEAAVCSVVGDVSVVLLHGFSAIRAVSASLHAYQSPLLLSLAAILQGQTSVIDIDKVPRFVHPLPRFAMVFSLNHLLYLQPELMFHHFCRCGLR